MFLLGYHVRVTGFFVVCELRVDSRKRGGSDQDVPHAVTPCSAAGGALVAV